MDSFPSLAWFQAAACHLQADEDVQQHARFLTARIALRVGDDTCLLHVERGAIRAGATDAGGHDFLLGGGAEGWRRLLADGWGLVRLYRGGLFEIQGDPVRVMQDWRALFFLVEGLRRFQVAQAQTAS